MTAVLLIYPFFRPFPVLTIFRQPPLAGPLVKLFERPTDLLLKLTRWIRTGPPVVQRSGALPSPRCWNASRVSAILRLSHC